MATRSVLGILLLLSLAAGKVTAAEVPVLLADVNQETETPFRSTAEPHDFFRLGDRLLFSTRGGYEDDGILWSTDGTAEGTHMVSSALCPVYCHGIKPLAVWRGLGILVTASGDPRDSYASVYRLWRTDGTKAGTIPLTGTLTDYPEVVSSPELGFFYFSGSRRATNDGPVLWRSDGTRAGTSVFQDARGATFYGPHSFTFWRGRLYFVAGDGEQTGIWSTDGTPEGTSFVTAVGEGAEQQSRLQATSSRLFFGSGESAEDLWVTDGTPEGTRRLLDLNPAVCLVQTDRCEPVELQSMFTLGEKFYFITNRKNHGNEIWSSDGTESGTRPLIEMPAYLNVPIRFDGRWLLSASGSLWTADDDFTRLEPLSGCAGGVCPQAGAFLHRTDSGAWLFAGGDTAHGSEVWITDGTGAGTRLLADVCPGPCDGYRGRYSSSTVLGSAVFGSAAGKTYFAAFSNPGTDSSVVDELWVTDGTPAGTHRVTGHVSDLGLLGDLAVFGTGGHEHLRSTIWSTDGTAAGTRRVTDLRMLAPGSDPSFHPLRNGVVFLAGEGDRQALWTSDGRPEGTFRFFEFPRNRNVYDDPWIRVGGLYFFQAESTDEDPRRVELWRTDGTAQGTGRVAIFPRQTSIDLPVAWNGKLLFETEGTTGCSFWSSDGTAAGTREILPPQPGMRCPTAVTAFGSRFVFVARVKGPDGLVPQIFVSDGTPEGTRQISRIRSYREAFEFDEPVAVGGVAFFRIHAAGRLHGDDWEVWRTDGTPEGTYRVSQASKWSEPNDLYGFRGSLYLSASIGTSAVIGYFRIPVRGGEPVLLAQTGYDVREFRYTPLESFTPLGDRLLFMAYDDTHGYELWVTDGTPAGTRLLRDIRTGPGSSRPSGFIQAGDRVFFTAQDGEHGRELWASDGTPEGTRLVWDLNPGGFSSFPNGPLNLPTLLTVAGGHLFFSADDGETGLEPWSLLVPSPAPAPPLARLPDTGRD
ncbi:MAG TPA: ELWxxDGT repeat protein [Thermoanaerobaculia bacterium]|nr:ELWxxDGT repeat protein [Thermoanaerobaculia bacterium]